MKEEKEQLLRPLFRKTGKPATSGNSRICFRGIMIKKLIIIFVLLSLQGCGIWYPCGECWCHWKDAHVYEHCNGVTDEP